MNELAWSWTALARITAIDHWPLWIAVGALVLATVLNYATGRIPNALNYPLILLGWITAGAVIGTGTAPSAGGGIGASLASTFLALGTLLPFYLYGKLPGGCIKAQMAFGAWTGCALGVGPAMAVTAIGSLTGGFLTLLILQLWIWRTEQDIQRREEELEAFGIEHQGKDDPQREFPCQLTQTLGSIAGVLAAFGFGVV